MSYSVNPQAMIATVGPRLNITNPTTHGATKTKPHTASRRPMVQRGARTARFGRASLTGESGLLARENPYEL